MKFKKADELLNKYKSEGLSYEIKKKSPDQDAIRTYKNGRKK